MGGMGTLAVGTEWDGNSADVDGKKCRNGAENIALLLLLLQLPEQLQPITIQKSRDTAKADEDVMEDGASVGIELFEVFVLASSRLGFHRLEVNVVVDKTFQADILAAEPWQFTQLSNTERFRMQHLSYY